MIDELEIMCPYCDEELPAPVNIEAGENNYVEECEYCHQDIELNFESNGETIFNVHINPFD